MSTITLTFNSTEALAEALYYAHEAASLVASENPHQLRPSVRE